jgi:hypothetical protein
VTVYCCIKLCYMHVLDLLCSRMYLSCIILLLTHFNGPEHKKTPWPESASELYRSSDRRLWAKFVPAFADRGCHVVRVTNPYGRNLGFLDRSRYFFFQVAPQLYSRGWVDPVPDPLLLRKSGSVGNQTQDLWICSQELWPVDHRGGLLSST